MNGLEWESPDSGILEFWTSSRNDDLVGGRAARIEQLRIGFREPKLERAPKVAMLSAETGQERP